MKNSCIFSLNKDCDDCGECNLCDLTNSKVCDSCGKCLEVETLGNEYKKVLIEEINDVDCVLEDDLSQVKMVPVAFEEGEEDNSENEVATEFIDDIEGLNDLMEDESNELLEEVFPGFFTFRK